MSATLFATRAQLQELRTLCRRLVPQTLAARFEAGNPRRLTQSQGATLLTKARAVVGGPVEVAMFLNQHPLNQPGAPLVRELYSDDLERRRRETPPIGLPNDRPSIFSLS